jgi:hypothetical protein
MCLLLIKLSFDKSKTSALGTTLLKCRIIRIPGLLDVGLREFLFLLDGIFRCYETSAFNGTSMNSIL